MVRRIVRRAPQRKLIWARSDHNITLPGVGTAVDLLADYRAQGGSTLGATVTRIRLDFDAISPPSVPATNGIFVQAGILVDQRQADQLQVPRPTIPNEPHADWMYWRSHYFTQGHSLVVATNGSWNTSWDVDVRAQRKMEELQETLWAVFNESAALTVLAGDTAITAQASVLLKLP